MSNNELGKEMDIEALLNQGKDNKEDEIYNEKMKKLTAGQIDPERSALEKYKQDKRVQVLFSVPECVKMDFLKQAIKNGFYRMRNGHKEAEQKKYFFHLLRKDGIEIPDDKKIDRRN